MGIRNKQAKQYSDCVRKKSSPGVWEVRSMGATAGCKTRTGEDLRGNAADLYSFCGVLEMEGKNFKYFEIIVWFRSCFFKTMVHSEIGPYDSWLYYYASTKLRT